MKEQDKNGWHKSGVLSYPNRSDETVGVKR